MSSTPKKKSSGDRDSNKKRRKSDPEPSEEVHAEEAPPNNQQQLFKRLFSEEDEIKLLNAVLDISNTTHVSPLPALIFDKVGDSFRSQFTNKQLTDKLSKLRRKYAKQINNSDQTHHKTTTHDSDVFNLSQKIWGEGGEDAYARHPSDSVASPTKEKRKVKTRSQASLNENREGATENGKAKVVRAVDESPQAVNGEEEAVAELASSKNFPFLIQEVSRLPWNAILTDGLRSLEGSVLRRLNEEWRLQHIEEVKVMAKRAQLVQEHTKLILEAIEFSLPD